jgi:2-iminobutanoate/2-iminopropanoate deaminase
MNTTRRNLLTAAPLLAVPASAKTKPSVKEVHYSKAKPTATPLYSEAISYGNLVFVSGHGVNDVSGIKAQTTKVLDDIEASLKASGTSMKNALKCNVYLAKLEDYAAMNEVYLGRFGNEPPVRTTLAVAGIPLTGCLVEIEVIAFR